MSSIERYRKAWVTLPSGRRVAGRRPGGSGVQHQEHVLRDQLARHVSGVTEASLGYGRADVLTESMVFEVEPLRSWRKGVRQVLAYSAQAGLPPALALFGECHRSEVLRVYLTLRDGTPPVALWWYAGRGWRHIRSRADCRGMASPQPPEPRRPPPPEPTEEQRRAFEAHERLSPVDRLRG